jgi:acyl-CoA thioesterase FadM
MILSEKSATFRDHALADLPGRQKRDFRPAARRIGKRIGKTRELARLAGISWHNKVGVVAWSDVMLERPDPAPLFFAPFVSSVMRVEPQWIDYNGHLNMAYYNVLFDRAVDETYELIGVGADYVAKCRQSVFTAEVHVRFLRELHASDPVRVTFQLLDYDDKRLHYFEQLEPIASRRYERDQDHPIPARGRRAARRNENRLCCCPARKRRDDGSGCQRADRPPAGG